jgi:UDP-N-acetylglucosamine 2-epimerase (non-hydrolysing)
VEPYILFIFGTRPEAIKLCPLIGYMKKLTGIRVAVCVTAQHREMLDQVLPLFGVRPDFDLGAMRAGQTLIQLTARILSDLESVLQGDRPSMVVVQGDTTTTLCGALAAFYAGVPVAHVEAGLRTGDPSQPFPEEMNRLLVSRLSTLHFPATPWAADNLRIEGVDPAATFITGNTGIDAVLEVAAKLDEGSLAAPRDWSMLDALRRLIVVTAHRRENFGEGLRRICVAVQTLADRSDVQIVYPVHPNPNIAGPVREQLGQHPNVILTEPLDYLSFVDLMRRCWFLLTDSGGVQEEAPSLGKPVLVLRHKTERPETLEAGLGTLVGTETEMIVSAAMRLLDDKEEYNRRARVRNPYGDGQASRQIGDVIRQVVLGKL